LVAAVDLVDAGDAGGDEFLLEVAGGGHELGEDHDLVLLKHLVFLEQLDQCLQLVVLAWLEPLEFAQEVCQLVHVEHSLGEHLLDLEFLAVKLNHIFQHLRRNDVIFLLVGIAEQFELVLLDGADKLAVLRQPPSQPLLLGRRH